MTDDDIIDTFIDNHEHVRDVVDARAGDALCTGMPTIAEAVLVSSDELDMHIRILKLDMYIDEPSDGMYCNRDATRAIATKLVTSSI